MRSILLYVLFLPALIQSHPIFEKLDQRIQSTDSLVCVGLDPDFAKMPHEIMHNATLSLEQKIYSFLTQIIDLTAPHASCFKIQKAFYDQYACGFAVMHEIIMYIHAQYPDVPVFIDCKIGDIDNTMHAYMQTIFENLHADGVTINPYMADEVFEPFSADAKKVGIVLIKTSNKNAQVVQDLRLMNGAKLWEEILHLTCARWNRNNNLMLVIASSASAKECQHIRNTIPEDMPILLVGVGAQGGNPEALKGLLNKDKRGVVVNSSRGILYSYDTANPAWRSAVLKAIIDFKNMLNEIRAITDQ